MEADCVWVKKSFDPGSERLRGNEAIGSPFGHAFLGLEARWGREVWVLGEGMGLIHLQDFLAGSVQHTTQGCIRCWV